MTRPPGRLPRLARAAAGLSAIAVLLAGPPCALTRLAGWPLPRHLPGWGQLQAFLTSPLGDDAIITGLACAVWLLWAMAAAALLLEAAAALAGHPAPRLPVIGPFQAAAAALIGATILTSLHAAQTAPPSPPPLQAALTATTAVTGPLLPGQPEPAAAPARTASPAEATSSRDAPAARPRVYRVVAGDDLWAIAARFLGNGENWHELFRLNAGKPQPDGRTLTDPSLIYPGWVLLLPPQDSHRGSAAQPGHHASPPPAPARTPAVSGTPHRDGSRGTPSPSPAGHRHVHSRPAAVRLPSGALVGISVAIMVAAALTLASIQRRRRYRPRASMTASMQPGDPPLPAVITALRRAARPGPADTPGEGAEPGPEASTPPAADPYPDPYDDTDPGPGQHGEPVPADRPGPGPEPSAPMPRPVAAGTSPPPARGPGAIPLGVRGTRETIIDIAALGGLGLTGTGAPAAARAILTALLAQAPPALPGIPAAIIIPAADAARLLPGEDTASIPGVSVPASLDAALDQMETALLTRARTTGALDDGEDPQATVSATGPAGPGAALIATTDPRTGQRLRSILESGRRLGVAAILLGPWPSGVTCQVAADGMITGVTPAGAGLEGIRLFHLSAAEAAAITAVLRDAHETPPAALAPASPGAAARPGRRSAGNPCENQTAADGPDPPAPATAGAPGPARDAPTGPAPRATATAAAAAPAPAAATDGEAATPDTARPVHLTMLGPLRITAAGQEVSGGMRKARELLAFLAVHPDGATSDGIGEALWPESDPGHATGQRNLALRKARDMLRTATGLAVPMWIIHASGRYRLDPALISTDLWQFTGALDEARHAATEETRLAACRKAAGLYHGDLAQDAGYDWAEPYAETARRRALDAWTTIAGILQPRDPDQALSALETALSHDPYNEYLYVSIMRLQAAAGHPEAVRRTLALLESRLTELGITPGTQTRQAAAALLAAAGPAPGRSSAPPVSRPAAQ